MSPGPGSPLDSWRLTGGCPPPSISRYDSGTFSWLGSSALPHGDGGHGDSSSSSSSTCCGGHQGQAKGAGELLPACPSLLLTLPSARAFTAALPILRFMVREMTARHFLLSFIPLLLPRLASSGGALLDSSSGIWQGDGE